MRAGDGRTVKRETWKETGRSGEQKQLIDGDCG